MRLFFFLLILANAIFFAWTQGYLGGNEAGREPGRLTNQIAPERLRVLAAGEKVDAVLCRTISGVAPDAAEGLNAMLVGVGLSVDIRLADAPPRFWVNIPPQPSLAAVEKKAAELRKLGVTDFSILSDAAPTRLSLSFGYFATETAAKEHLLALAKRGVRSARVDERELPPPATRITVRGPTEAVTKRLPELLGKLPEPTTTTTATSTTTTTTGPTSTTTTGPTSTTTSSSTTTTTALPAAADLLHFWWTPATAWRRSP